MSTNSFRLDGKVALVTGEGAMLALNSFPGMICGHVEDPVDAYTFAHVNDGNAVAMPFIDWMAVFPKDDS